MLKTSWLILLFSFPFAFAANYTKLTNCIEYLPSAKTHAYVLQLKKYINNDEGHCKCKIRINGIHLNKHNLYKEISLSDDLSEIVMSISINLIKNNRLSKMNLTSRKLSDLSEYTHDKLQFHNDLDYLYSDLSFELIDLISTQCTSQK